MSDSITVTCPTCQVRGTVPAALLGKSVKCPECKGQVPVVRRDAPPAPPRPAAAAEPECYGRLLALADNLTGVCAVLTIVGVALAAIAFVVAMLERGRAGEPVMAAAVAVGVQLVVGMVMVTLGQRVVQVFVDLARNVRGIRVKVEQGS